MVKLLSWGSADSRPSFSCKGGATLITTPSRWRLDHGTTYSLLSGDDSHGWHIQVFNRRGEPITEAHAISEAAAWTCRNVYDYQVDV